eukprot:TCONS_00030117-protein
MDPYNNNRRPNMANNNSRLMNMLQQNNSNPQQMQPPPQYNPNTLRRPQMHPPLNQQVSPRAMYSNRQPQAVFPQVAGGSAQFQGGPPQQSTFLMSMLSNPGDSSAQQQRVPPQLQQNVNQQLPQYNQQQPQSAFATAMRRNSANATASNNRLISPTGTPQISPSSSGNFNHDTNNLNNNGLNEMLYPNLSQRLLNQQPSQQPSQSQRLPVNQPNNPNQQQISPNNNPVFPNRSQGNPMGNANPNTSGIYSQNLLRRLSNQPEQQLQQQPPQLHQLPAAQSSAVSSNRNSSKLMGMLRHNSQDTQGQNQQQTNTTPPSNEGRQSKEPPNLTPTAPYPSSSKLDGGGTNHESLINNKPKDLTLDPLADITDNLINSPMSVGSSMSDGSLGDIRRLATLSLSINSPPVPPFATDKLPTPISPLPPVNSNPSNSQTVDTKPPEENALDPFHLDEDMSKASFIDAFLKGMMTDLRTSFSSDDKNDVAVPDGEYGDVDIDLLDENVLMNMIEAEDKELARLEEECNPFKRSLSQPDALNQRSKTPPMNSPPSRARKPPKNNTRVMRMKSDSSDRRLSNHPYKPSLNLLTETEKPVLRRCHTVGGEKPSFKQMYFENKGYFKFRSYFRDLVRRNYQAGDLSSTQFKQKSSRLFLNMLTKHYEWVTESVQAAVQNDKDINMKNFTKRKITILNDVPPEHIHQFSEVPSDQPFTYSSFDVSGKTKPSDKLMEYLQVSKETAARPAKQRKKSKASEIKKETN